MLREANEAKETIEQGSARVARGAWHRQANPMPHGPWPMALRYEEQ